MSCKVCTVSSCSALAGTRTGTVALVFLRRSIIQDKPKRTHALARQTPLPQLRFGQTLKVVLTPFNLNLAERQAVADENGTHANVTISVSLPPHGKARVANASDHGVKFLRASQGSTRLEQNTWSKKETQARPRLRPTSIPILNSQPDWIALALNTRSLTIYDTSIEN